MSRIVQIYMFLPEEAVDVWRPVQAEHLHGDVYRILNQPYDRDDESWQFEPGDEVVCELTDLEHGRVLVAIRKADQR